MSWIVKPLFAMTLLLIVSTPDASACRRVSYCTPCYYPCYSCYYPCYPCYPTPCCDWDCITNKTAKTLKVSIVTGTCGYTVTLPPGYGYRFRLCSCSTNWTFVAFDVSNGAFVDAGDVFPLPQCYPPTNCILIDGVPGAHGKSEMRHQME